MRTTDHIQRLLDPEFTAGIEGADADALRLKKQECNTIETSVSYYRRLAQARAEILTAERDRRSMGGSVEDLIAKLPEILAGEQPRADGANSRFSSDTIVELDWDGRESLVADDTLANLPLLTDDQLDETIAALGEFERDLSERRSDLHQVIDRLDGAIERVRSGSA